MPAPAVHDVQDHRRDPLAGAEDMALGRPLPSHAQDRAVSGFGAGHGRMDGATKMTTGTAGDQPLALRLLLKLLAHLSVGRLRLVAPDGTSYQFQGDAGPEAVIILRHVDAARRVLLGGDLGLAEAYMDGQWETPDLMAFLELGLRNMQALSVDRPGLLHRLFDSLVHALRRNTRRGARRNIQRHYDLGNAFYKLWLDETLTYSSAIFDAPDQS